MTRKPRVVTFRMDEATWGWMRKLAPYTRYGTASSFIREGIDLLLKHEDEHRRGGRKSLDYNEGTANFAFAEPEREYGPAPFGRHSACTIC